MYFFRFKNWLIRKLGGRPNKASYGKHIYEDMNCGEIGNRHILKNLSKEDLIDIICSDDKKLDWFKEYCIRDKECKRLKQLFSSSYYNDKELNKALHMSDLEKKNKVLKREVRQMQEKAEEFNNLLYATGYIVNCTGCVPGKPANAENLTEEKVQTVELLAKRLRTWWNNNKDRIGNKL